MTLPNTDDLLLFGSLLGVAVGALLIASATTGNALLSIGVGLIVFSVPTALITFMASGETK